MSSSALYYRTHSAYVLSISEWYQNSSQCQQLVTNSDCSQAVRFPNPQQQSGPWRSVLEVVTSPHTGQMALTSSIPTRSKLPCCQPTDCVATFSRNKFFPLYYTHTHTRATGHIIKTCSTVSWSLCLNSQEGKSFAMTSCLNHDTTFRNMGKWPTRQHFLPTITSKSHAVPNNWDTLFQNIWTMTLTT